MVKANRFNFRAWDGIKIITRDVYCHEGLAYQARMNERVVLPLDWRGDGDQDVILMQSTGLADKNGVEMFEADIGNVIYKDGPLLCVVRKNPELPRIIIQPVDTHNYGYQDLIGSRKDFEVIGNIHENPELMEGL